MIVSYNWLKEFVEFDLPPEELAHLLTMLGLEVEGMERRFGDLDNVVVAQVIDKQQHPNADKLSLCKVDNGAEILGIVCGAQNFKAGDKVALAQIGAVLPGDFRIKKSKIRGEESSGMLCSEKELGLAEDSAGIMILPQDLQLGTPVFDALGLKDTIFEVGLTPNRADCLSVVGIAREVAAKLGKRISYPVQKVVESGAPIDTVASVTVEDPHGCPRYTARYISGCTIGPSPQWLVNRLQAVGMRSINNVVDVTNYVLLEYGHPLHAFDFDLLTARKIVVKRASDQDKFTTLDGQERVLISTDLTICDGEKAVALAGIMGGGNSEIRDVTRNILLESAYFAPSGIRRTSKRLGLHTESSHRFERGTDINILTRALDRAASLIAELASGSVATGVIDVYPQPVEQRKITLNCSKVNKLLGLDLSEQEIVHFLERLEFKAKQIERGVYEIVIPTFRVDIEREIDLIEEVARLNGYERIPVTMPLARVFSDRPPRHQRLETQIRSLLVDQGFNEVINFSFVSPSALEKLLPEADVAPPVPIKLLNPLAEEQSVMRTTLISGLLETVKRNLNFRTMTLRIFELRRIYLAHPERELPEEPMMLGAVMVGRRNPEGWNQGKEEVDFYDAKGVAEHLLASLRIRQPLFSTSDLPPYFHPGKSCRIFSGTEAVGSVGELHPTVSENFGIDKQIFYIEFNFEKLLSHVDAVPTIVPPPRFPDTFRDVALLLDEELPAQDVVGYLQALNVPELEGIDIFDFYKGEHVPEGKKSIAIRIRYRSADRTLTDDEVNPIHQRLVEKMVKNLKASIR
ncbi:phenylalanine--tRNA ligase subunit beta [Geobacter sp. DSM 9736]|uniref:phenylalanine--tRNA ligase subunit beta n=1 Tax=Geobacter sp. DSM 9736 TaxID=1277350 RepID=UPI000B50578A|nr:phenylalanine--tRNA ligase subunit beta [Geobacter sp. DSM 9736]SNB45355.1 phenylalanyl-tRNA synthetase beta subunit [Geobacter sp. DSM 9736]